MNHKEIVKEVHESLLRLRGIETVLSTLKFQRLWEASTESERDEAILYIRQHSRDGLARWMKDHSSFSFGEMSSRQLVAAGKKAGIRNYSRLGKLELIMALEDYYKDKK